MDTVSEPTLVDYDPLTKIETHVDVSDEGIMTVASMQDAEDIIADIEQALQ